MVNTYILYCGVLIGASLATIPPEEPKDSPEHRLVRSIAGAKTPAERAKGYAELFRILDKNKLAQLREHEDASIALQAAWETWRPHKGDPLAIRRLERFSGFLEAKTVQLIPPRWEINLFMRSLLDYGDVQEDVFKHYVGKTAALKLRGERAVYQAVELVRTEMKFRVPRGTQALHRESGIEFRSSEKVAFVKSKILEEPLSNDPEGLIVSWLLDREKLLVAVYNQFAETWPLICVDIATGEALWKTRVWGLRNPLGGATGAWRHEVEMAYNAGKVTVFGVGTGGCYVEIFNAKDGNSTCRFSTNYWDLWDGLGKVDR